MKAQTAVEFLLTYGFALTIIGIGIAALYAYFLFKNPTSYVSGFCSISSLYCSTAIAIKGNSTVPTYILLYITNSFSKTISFPQNSFNVIYYTTSKNGTCLPSTLIPGATAICIANITLPSINVGDTLRVNIRIPFIYLNQKFNASGFADLVVSPTISQSSLTSSSLSLTTNSYNGYWPGDGITPVMINALVKINNYPQRGIQVNFSSNDSRVVIFPNLSVTNAFGIAIAYAKTTAPISSPIKVKITAKYSGFSTATQFVTLTFMKKFEDFEKGMNGWSLCTSTVGYFVYGYGSFSALRINSTGGNGLACAYKGLNVVSGEVVSYACRGYGCRLCVNNGSTCINSPNLSFPFNATWRIYFTNITRTQNGVNLYIYNNGTRGAWADYDNIYTSV